MTTKKIKVIKSLDDIRGRERNPNQGTDRGRLLTRTSLTQFGAGRSVVVDRSGQLIGGHTTTDGFRSIAKNPDDIIVVQSDGSKLVVVQRTDLDKDDPRGRMLAAVDNITSHVGYNPDRDEYADLGDSLIESGYLEQNEIDSLFAEADPVNTPEVDPKTVAAASAELTDQHEKAAAELAGRGPELQAKWKTENGRVWQIGRHRLMCGSSVSSVDVGRLCGDRKFAACFTSPPYNVGANAVLHGNTHFTESLYLGDADAKTEVQYLEFLQSFTDLAAERCKYVFVNVQALAGNKRAVARYWMANLERYCDVIVWNKGQTAPAMAERVVNSSFEFIFVFAGLDANNSRAIGTRDFRGTVSNVYSGMGQRNNEYSDVNAATFPIHLPIWALAAFTNPGDAIYEPFNGTGTTMMAAQELNRICYGMDKDPQCCAATLERMSLAGLTPKLLT